MNYRNESIYAIVRKENSNQLEFITEPIVIDYSVDDSTLCKYYEYAPDLGDAYSSELIAITPQILKNNCFQKDARFRAYAFEQTIKKVLSKYDVVAYSHRQGGWKNFHWEYNKDISFSILTNFGYGGDSYFCVLYKFKNTLLCPYADYVKYRNSTVGDILNHTRSYRLEYEEWEFLLKSTLDFYNAIIDKDENYIIDWIHDNLQQLVRGLRSFLVNFKMDFKNGAYEYSMKISSFTTVTEDDFWVLKSSKIANALDFIENFKILPVEFGAMCYVQPILDICKDFYPLLQQKIDEITKELEEQESKYTEVTGSDLFILYKKLYNKYYYKYGLYMKSGRSLCLFFIRALRRLHIQYDINEIRRNLKELKNLINVEEHTRRRIASLKEIHKNLTKDIKKIEFYFEKSTDV